MTILQRLILAQKGTPVKLNTVEKIVKSLKLR